MAYKKPTLTETYAEIHLAPGVLSEAQFFDVVPRLKTLGFSEVEFSTVGLKLDIKQGRPPRELQRVRCWKPGRTQLVQVGEDLLVANLTGEYPGWSSFVQLFDEAYQALVDGLGKVEPVSLNVAALDSFEVPKEGFSVSEYLAVGGMIIPQWYAQSAESLDLTLGRGLLEVDGENRQVHVSVRSAADPVKISFRTQCHDRLAAGSDLKARLQRLHDNTNSIFEALITDRVRQTVMGGQQK